MTFLWRGLRQALHLIITGNAYIRHVTWVTLEVVVVSTVLAVAIGLPIGVGIGLGRFRGRSIALVIANTGLMLPPVVIGLFLALLMFPEAPLGRFHLLFTLHGVYIAQTVLAVPIVVALTSSAVSAVPRGLLAQARAFDAGRLQVWAFAVREARIGILTAVIGAVGSALSEVGAVVLVGGNILGADQTLGSAALQAINQADFSTGIAIGIILLGLILVVTAALTVAQQRDGRALWIRPSS